MKLGREIPLNPNIAVYHTDEPLTTAIVETYRESGDAPTPCAEILDAGAESVHVTRYRIAVRKPDAVDMMTFLEEIEPPLCEWADLLAIPSAPEATDKWCTFDIDLDPTLNGGREVYEGSDSAQANPVAAHLFEIPGVAEIILMPKVVVIGKGRMFSWMPMFSEIERFLRS